MGLRWASLVKHVGTDLQRNPAATKSRTPGSAPAPLPAGTNAEAKIALKSECKRSLTKQLRSKMATSKEATRGAKRFARSARRLSSSSKEGLKPSSTNETSSSLAPRDWSSHKEAARCLIHSEDDLNGIRSTHHAPPLTQSQFILWPVPQGPLLRCLRTLQINPEPGTPKAQKR